MTPSEHSIYLASMLNPYQNVLGSFLMSKCCFCLLILQFPEDLRQNVSLEALGHFLKGPDASPLVVVAF